MRNHQKRNVRKKTALSVRFFVAQGESKYTMITSPLNQNKTYIFVFSKLQSISKMRDKYNVSNKDTFDDKGRAKRFSDDRFIYRVETRYNDNSLTRIYFFRPLAMLL